MPVDIAQYLRDTGTNVASDYFARYGRPAGSDSSEEPTSVIMLGGKPYYLTNKGGIWNPEGGDNYGSYLGLNPDQQIDDPNNPRSFNEIRGRGDGGYDLLSNRGETYQFANPNYVAPTPTVAPTPSQQTPTPSAPQSTSTLPYNWDYEAAVRELSDIRNSALGNIGINRSRLGEDYGLYKTDLQRNTSQSLKNNLDQMASQGLNRSGILEQGQTRIQDDSNLASNDLDLNKNRGITDLEMRQSDVENSYNTNLEALKKRLLDYTQQNEAERLRRAGGLS